MPSSKSGAPAPADLTQVRNARLADVSSQLTQMIASLRQSRETLQGRRGEAPTPPPGALPAVSAGEPEQLRAELAAARAAEAELRSRLDEIEEVNAAVGDEVVALQSQMAHAAALTVVLRRLHEAGTAAGVLDGIQEVVANVLGCEDFVLLSLRGGRAEPVRAMGRAGVEAAAVAAVAEAARAGRVLSGEAAARIAPGLTMLVPLAARGSTVGAAALFDLLPQKGPLGPDDEEVAELLQLHGALAWQAADGAVDGR